MFGANVVHKKLVVVGDGFCGKTSLLMVYKHGAFPEVYVPTVFEADTVEIISDGRKIMLGLFDTAGQEDYDRLRPLSYPNTDVAMICFSLNDIDTLINVAEKWAPEIHHFCPSVPIVLVGTKKDLITTNSNATSTEIEYYSSTGKRNHQMKPVKTVDAKMMAQKIGASAYLECSAKLDQGVSEVFSTAARLALAREKKKRKKICIIL